MLDAAFFGLLSELNVFRPAVAASDTLVELASHGIGFAYLPPTLGTYSSGPDGRWPCAAAAGATPRLGVPRLGVDLALLPAGSTGAGAGELREVPLPVPGGGIDCSMACICPAGPGPGCPDGSPGPASSDECSPPLPPAAGGRISSLRADRCRLYCCVAAICCSAATPLVVDWTRIWSLGPDRWMRADMPDEEAMRERTWRRMRGVWRRSERVGRSRGLTWRAESTKWRA